MTIHHLVIRMVVLQLLRINLLDVHRSLVLHLLRAFLLMVSRLRRKVLISLVLQVMTLLQPQHVQLQVPRSYYLQQDVVHHLHHQYLLLRLLLTQDLQAIRATGLISMQEEL